MASRRKRFRPATEAVHGGTLRSQFAETSEAMFLTQGFVYPDAEAAEARQEIGDHVLAGPEQRP